MLSNLDAEVAIRDTVSGEAVAGGWIVTGSTAGLRLRLPGTNSYEVTAQGNGFVQAAPLIVSKAATERFTSQTGIIWFAIDVVLDSDRNSETTYVVASNARRPVDFELMGLIGNTSTSLVDAAAGTNRANGQNPQWCKAHQNVGSACSYGTTSLLSERDAYDSQGYETEFTTVTDGNRSCVTGALNAETGDKACNVRIMVR